MKTRTFKNEIVACAVALVGCVGIVGCQMNENGDASVAAEESADEAVVKGNIVSNVVEWLKPYQMKIPFVVENEGKDVYIRGMAGFSQLCSVNIPSLFILMPRAKRRIVTAICQRRCRQSAVQI